MFKIPFGFSRGSWDEWPRRNSWSPMIPTYRGKVRLTPWIMHSQHKSSQNFFKINNALNYYPSGPLGYPTLASSELPCFSVLSEKICPSIEKNLYLVTMTVIPKTVTEAHRRAWLSPFSALIEVYKNLSSTQCSVCPDNCINAVIEFCTWITECNTKNVLPLSMQLIIADEEKCIPLPQNTV